jgi:hypothetical protein
MEIAMNNKKSAVLITAFLFLISAGLRGQTISATVAPSSPWCKSEIPENAPVSC